MNASEIRELRRQRIKQWNFAATRLVERNDFHAIAKPRSGMRFHHADILDEHVVANVIAGQVAADVCNSHTVADHAILHARMVNATRFRRPAGPLNIPSERSQSDLAGEIHTPHALGEKWFRHLQAAPILGGATLFRQLLDFIRRQRPIIAI